MSDTKLGYSVEVATSNEVRLRRTTLESDFEVRLDAGARRGNRLDTGNNFVNHMLDGMASRLSMNLDIVLSSGGKIFDHVIAEDSGLLLGRAIREMIEARRPSGVCERGNYTVAFDEALVSATLAFDGRSYVFLHGNCPARELEWVEDIQATSLKQFFEGFAQGSGCAIHIQLWSAEDSHHLWEAVFKAFGEALREALAKCAFRANTTLGLKGTGIEK